MYWYQQYFLFVPCLKKCISQLFHENKKLNTLIQAKERHWEHKSMSTKNKSQSRDIHIIIRSLMVKVVISYEEDGSDPNK